MKINNTASRGFLFDSVKIDTPNRSAFDLSYENRLTLSMGKLVPTFCKEVLPNDDVNLSSNYFARFAPLVAPVMQKIDLMTYNFFVPNRIIWSDWESFISPGAGNVTMANQPNFVAPQMPYFTGKFLYEQIQTFFELGTSLGLKADVYNWFNVSVFPVLRLLDYLGYPFSVSDIKVTYNADSNELYYTTPVWDTNETKISALPIMAFFKVYDDYVRDQNLEEPYNVVVGSDWFTSDNELIFFRLDENNNFPGFSLGLVTKCWEKDYFTSALTDPQRGATVYLPLGDSAPITIKEGTSSLQLGATTSGGITTQSTSSDTTITASFMKTANGTWTLVSGNTLQQPASVTSKQVYANRDQLETLANNMVVDLSKASSITIETLRAAYSLQEFMEKFARTGARYCESMLAHFGQAIEDARLDRPEFLGGNRNPVSISDVMQNAPTFDGSEQTSAVGDYAGKAITSGNNYFDYHVSEHGWIIQLVCVLPRTSYSQGLGRQFTRMTYLDYAWPEFAHLGEQEILNQELYYAAGSASLPQDGVFGYTPRYADYKYSADEVHGEFKTSLNYWTLSRQFNSQPTLSKDFVHCQPRTDIFAVTDENLADNVYLDVWHDYKVLRCLPMFGTPHF